MYSKLITRTFYIIILYVLSISRITYLQLLGPSDQPEAFFNGSSYIRLETTISLRRHISFSFRSCSGGELFSQTRNEYSIELSVNPEEVLFRVKTPEKYYDEKIRGDYINNKWHIVHLTYKLGNLTLSVNEDNRLLANSTYRSELLTSPELYDDGAILIVGNHFVGCILEGPSITFNSSLIHPHNVIFGSCPIPMNSCVPRQDLKESRAFDYCTTEPCMRHGSCLNGQNTYTCVCLPRYSGKNCEIDLGNLCDKDPNLCKNGGTCYENNGNYNCNCLPGFEGRYCEQEVTINPLCSQNPCSNNGLCRVHPSGSKVECICPPGFTGSNCETNINDCQPNPCLNNGICHDGNNSYTCECSHTGYSGKNCEINENECRNNPCLNHGTCFDTYGGYTCQCPPGFDGKNCQYNVYECISQPCLNNGQCIDKLGSYECRCQPGFAGENCELEVHQTTCTHPNCSAETVCINNPCLNGGTCSPSLTSYNCTCAAGFTGPACERLELCQPDTCRNGGICHEDAYSYRCICTEDFKGSDCSQHMQCADGPCEHATACQDFADAYYCTCEQGWTGLNCNININHCSNEPCHNGGTCIDLLDTFKCQCLQGFTGIHCQINIDECSSNPCLNGGLCIDIQNGYYCNCTEQWMGPNCDRPYDICETKPCYNNGTCISSANKKEYTCECPKGFEGYNCEINIDECIGITCPRGQVCVDLVATYECRCPIGYIGEDCSTLTDPCIGQVCSNGGTCNFDPLARNITCSCYPGYQGLRCETDVDECFLNPGLCTNGICINSNGGYDCYCRPGYTGEDCSLDFDECLSMPCQNNATCINMVNNFECKCPLGYAGKTCSDNIDECQSSPCTAGSTCIDGINNFKCICLPGLTGSTCNVNINDCESSPCMNGGQCIDGLNSYTCNCTNTGFFGTHCEMNIDDCVGNPCVNGGQCIDDVNDYHCRCFKGYTGKNCEVDINECENGPCKNSGMCLQRSNETLYQSKTNVLNLTLPEIFQRPFEYEQAEGYECLCVPGVVGRNCEININECESSPCVAGNCVDQIGGYVCECEEGFEGVHCETEINECEKYRPCMHGECVDKRASYYCKCNGDYGGKNCSVQLTGCLENPCSNNGTCKPYLVNETEHKFNCSCSNGFHGHTCEKITTMSLSGQSSVTVNTTRDEGYDIQFRFKTTLGDGLLALGRGLTYYILELSHGRLNLHSSLLNKWEGVFIGSNLNDSNWQRVFVAINSSHLVLSANDEQTIYPITFNENYNATYTSFATTYIGGVPSNLRKLAHTQPFLVGCLEDVIINGEWVLPELQNSSGIDFLDVEVGCHREPQCNPNPCHSGGHCTDKWRDFSCTCERPYLGHTCQYNYTAATFGYENITNSLVTVTVADAARRAIRSIVDISMFIRTRQSRGQIFYLGSALNPNNIAEETYIAAQLEGGELLVRIQFNATPEAYTVGGVKLNNGYNHLIEVIRNTTLVQVKLNGTEYFRKTISATGTLDAQVLFLGGQPQLRPVRQAANGPSVITKADMTTTTGSAAAVTTPLSMIHFKGIIQDVQISNGSKVMVVEFFPLKVEELNIPMSFGTVTFDDSTILEGVLSDDSCKINPCHHNGVCSNTWNDYRCKCTRGFKGKDCTEQEFCELEGCPEDARCRNLEDGYECIANSTFNGETPPLLYNFVENVTKPAHFDTLEIMYRTRSWGTLLFANYLENYFAIFVYHDKVFIDWNLGGSILNKQFHKEHFEGQWLTLYLEVKENTLKGGFKELVKDDTPNFIVEGFDLMSFTEMFAKGIIIVGGSDNKIFDYKSIIENEVYNNVTTYVTVIDTTTDFAFTSNAVELPENGFTTDNPLPLYRTDVNKTSDRFKGCLGEIRIGKLLLPFYNSSTLYKRNYPDEYFELNGISNFSVGCQLCYNTDCYNGGQCSDPINTYKCNCPLGFAAEDCSIDINECENNKCQNGATCMDEIAKYECKCASGFEGDFCENEIDECASNPCHHGGTCIDLLAAFKCECPEDYVGRQCEALRLITCENQPCKEGATCQDGRNVETGNNFTCVCNEGYVGPLCDTAYCLRQHCEAGFCNTTDQKPICQCQPGFEGKFCEINIDDCDLPTGNPCKHGGICIDGNNRYDCNCTSTGYSGLLCEMDIDECVQIVNACGEGICKNVPGSYMCDCPTGSCGYGCEVYDPCQRDPCEHGKCISNCKDVPDYICECEEHFAGKNCTEDKLEARSESAGINTLYIVLPIVVIILIIVVIATLVLVNTARSKRATRGTYSPSAQEFCNPRVELDHVLKPPPEERLI